MSSLATADSPRGLPRRRAGGWARVAAQRLSADAWLGLALAAGLALEAFVTTGGVALGANTWAEIVLTLIGAGLCAAAVVHTPAGRIWGATALVLFALLATLTMASIAWSVQPANSWVEASRTVSYLAVFAGGLALARLMPARWPAIVGSIGVCAAVVSGYALLVKVFPATLDPGEVLGRLRAPFDYWNAVGLISALGLPACLWAGARREGGVLMRALAAPTIALLVTVLVLSYSRGALLVSVAGLALWFAVVPLRLRGAVVLGAGVLGGAGVTLWALSTHPITRDVATLPSRTTAGHAFGLLLVLMVVLLGGAGAAIGFAMDRAVVPRRVRRRVGAVLLTLVACVPAAGLTSLALSSRGLTGQISHAWQMITDAGGGAVGDNAGRLVQVSNSRGRYWSEGFKVGEHYLLTGAGALGYATARIRYSRDQRVAQHAHSFVVETFADFGLIGLVVSLALLLSWCVAARRALGRTRPRRYAWRRTSASPTSAPRVPAERAAERAGLLTLWVIVVTFGLHSAIDWTWFVPGVTAPALMCAGWLAGRGPLAEPVARVADGEPRVRRIRRLWAREPPRLGALAAIVAIVAIALTSAWSILQPLRSENADQAALAALAAGKAKQALDGARTAAARNPVSVEPLWNLSVIFSATGHSGAARRELVDAVRLQPSNPQTWLALGEYDLQSGQPREALAVLQAALYLGPNVPETQSAVAQARSALGPAAPVSRP